MAPVIQSLLALFIIRLFHSEGPPFGRLEPPMELRVAAGIHVLVVALDATFLRPGE